MAVDFAHLETDFVPVDGRGCRGSGGRVGDAVGAVGGHGACFRRLSKPAGRNFDLGKLKKCESIGVSGVCRLNRLQTGFPASYIKID